MKLIQGIFALFCLAVLGMATTTSAWADDPPGTKLYSTYCSACHGQAGKNGPAPAIGDSKYLEAKDDAAITQATADGIVAKGMPAWGKSKGGALTDDQIKDIVTYLRSLAGSATTATATTTATTSSTQQVKVFIQTKLAMTQSRNEYGDTLLSLSLKEYDGYPVGGGTVAFSRATTFGTMDLGTAKTDAAGNASLVLRDLPEGSQIVATFKGDKNWDASSTQLKIDASTLMALPTGVDLRSVRLAIDEPLLAPDGSLITPNPPLVPATLFLLVVGGVWSMYVFVASQIIGIWKLRAPEPTGNVLRMQRK